MPQLQVVDTTPNKPEPTEVQQFFSKLSKSYQEKQEGDEIGKLLKTYQANRDDEFAIEDYMQNVQSSPAARKRWCGRANSDRQPRSPQTDRAVSWSKSGRSSGGKI
jgi:hypothetical protein